jgi:hypothetical protein
MFRIPTEQESEQEDIAIANKIRQRIADEYETLDIDEEGYND